MTDEINNLAAQVVARHQQRTRGADPEPAPDARLLVPTGSTLLNLALSDSPWGGLLPGKVVALPGESTSGKTMLALHIAAEVASDDRFSDWRVIYDPAEGGSEINIAKMFGKRTADRMEFPAKDADGEPCASDTVESFMVNLVRVAREGRPFVYVLDSLDGLVAQEELDILNAKVAGKEAKGSRGQEKAKQMSQLLRLATREIERSGGILLLILQTRDDQDNPWGGQTYSGGRAIKFYSTLQMWCKVVERIKTTDKKHELGVMTEVNVKKNKATGKPRKVRFPIFYSIGIDDVGSCVDWLVSEGVWTQRGGTIDTDIDGLGGTRTKVIRAIELEGMERRLRQLVGRRWAEVEARLDMPERKRRYI